MASNESIKILLVEDDAFLAQELRDCLFRIGYRDCGMAPSIEQAFVEIAKNKPDLVLVSDHLCRPINGGDAAARIREQFDLPVVLASVSANSVLTGEPSEVRSYGLPPKPFSEIEIHTSIQVAIHCYPLERQLRETNAQLEENVRNRTALFEHANRRLSTELESRVRSEKKIRTKKERLSLALLASDQGLWDWNLVSGEVYLCPKFLELTGLSQEQARFEKALYQKVIHPDEFETAVEAFERHLRGETDVVTIECRILRNSGEYRWIRAVGKVVERDSSGTAVRMVGSISDFDDRKRLELTLSHFRQAVYSTNMGILMIDAQAADHPVTYVNPAYTVLTGYSPEETIGKTFGFLSQTEVPQPAIDELRVAIAKRQPCHVVLRNVRKDGTLLWFDLWISPIVGQQGVVSHFAGLLHDVTARTEAEDAVRSSEAKLSATLDAISDAVLSTDVQGRITRMNPVAERLTGWAQSDARGLLAAEVYRTAGREGQLPAAVLINQTLATGEFHRSIEGTVLTARDGSKRPIADSVAPIRDKHGTILGAVLVFRDVTSEQAAAQQISSLLKDLKDIKVALDEHSIVSITDAHGYITYVNDKFCSLAKASPEELIGHTFQVINSGFHPREFFWDLRATVIHGQVWHGEILHRAYDGTRFWVDTTIVPFLNADRKPYQYVVIQTDITARKLAEDRIKRDILVRKQAEEILRRSNEELESLVSDRKEKLLQSEERLRIFVENVPAGVAMFDREMRYLAHSNRWRSDYRLGDQELIGRSHYDVFRDHSDRAKEIHQRCLTGVSERGDQDPYELADGVIEYFRWEIQPWRNSSGMVGGLVIFTELITEQVLAQQALRESEDRFRQIATSINHIFWMYSMPDRRYLYVSPAFETIWGRPLSDLYTDSTSWIQFVHPDDRAKVKSEIRGWDLKQNIGELEFRIIRNQDEIRWICIRGISIRFDDDGKYRITGVAEDVTDKKQMEVQVLQSQKLQAVGQLAGGIAHDFNNFLLLISCCSEQLLTQLSDNDPNRKSVIAIRDAGARAARLTRQLLAFTRKQVLDLVVVDLHELISRATELMKPAIRENVRLNLRLSAEPATIKVDPGQIDQVLLNLFLNAQDAMPNGGEVTITTLHDYEPEPSSLSDPELRIGRYVRMTVSDTGLGMTDEVKSRIFEPYFTTKQVGKGTGLGMAVVHGIVSQSGGFVNVKSTVGVGSEIEILFPYAEHEDAALVVSSQQPHDVSGTETILLAEDGTDLRQILRRTLEAYGYAVIEAEHGPAAIAAAMRYDGPIDLLLTDVAMPEMSGCEVADALSAVYPHLRTIFISGYADDELLMERAKSGMHVFLQKPFDNNELLAKVREVLDERIVVIN